MEINWDGAIKELERRGRATGLYERSDGTVCALGAVLAAEGVDLWAAMCCDTGTVDKAAHDAAKVLAPIIREQFPNRDFCGSPNPWRAVTGFNDDPITTTEEVIAVFEKARASETL